MVLYFAVQISIISKSNPMNNPNINRKFVLFNKFNKCNKFNKLKIVLKNV